LQQQCKTPKTKTTKSPACTTKYAPNCIQALTPISRRQQKGEGKNVKKKMEKPNQKQSQKSQSKWKMEMCKAAQQGLHLASIFIF